MQKSRLNKFISHNTSYSRLAALDELTLGTEVAALQFVGLLLGRDDGLLASFLLLGREEGDVRLVALVGSLCLGLQSRDLALPALGELLELLVHQLVGGILLEDVVHIDEGELLRCGAEYSYAHQAEEEEHLLHC